VKDCGWRIVSAAFYFLGFGLPVVSKPQDRFEPREPPSAVFGFKTREHINPLGC
jgi:hypothetical protein